METKRLMAKARAVILKLSNSKLIAAWHTWTDMAQRCGRLRMIGLRTIARWRSSVLSEAFVTWENQVSSSKKASRAHRLCRNSRADLQRRLDLESGVFLNPRGSVQVPSRNLEIQMEKRLSTEVQLGKLLQDHQDLLARLLQAEDELQQQRDRVTFLRGKSQVYYEKS